MNVFKLRSCLVKDYGEYIRSFIRIEDRRARAAFESNDLLCIGTSATMSSAGTWPERQAEIAKVASQVFGTTVTPQCVIGETLRRATEEPTWGPAFDEELQRSVEAGPVASTAFDALLREPIVRWLEATVGVRQDPSGRLVRARPIPLRGEGGVADTLAQACGLPEDECTPPLFAALEAAARSRGPEGRPLFGVRLHQFFSKGDTVYASPESEEARHVTLQAQRFAPKSERKKALLPLAFCRECGQDYYLVRRRRREDGVLAYEPRDLGDTAADGGDAGFLYLSTKAPWPLEPNQVRGRLPDSWLDGDVVLHHLRNRLPRSVHVRPDATEGVDGLAGHFVPAPFSFCLVCGVAYGARQSRDFGKLATLGSEGRSTATTILSLSTIRTLRGDETVDPVARKLLTFTDNRQDASLQAGHFNDFADTGLLRAALAKAVPKDGPGLPHDELPRAVFNALGLPLSAYAQNDQVRFAHPWG
ncbi:MAG: hypothetical protein WCI05_07860 [Myxococcales bacterium]